MERFASTSTDTEEAAKETEKAAAESNKKSLISEERAETGRVTFAVILAYCRACTWYMTLFVLVFNVVTNVFAVVTNFWLADWSNAAAAGGGGEGNQTVVQVTACDGANSTE